MNKSLILAALLAPSFCFAQTKEEKKQQLSVDMTALILKMIAADHLMIINLWREYLTINKDMAANLHKEGLEDYAEAEKLFEQMKALEAHE
jgi:hypothetical protein